MNQIIKENYTAILKEELVLALGCTEPISIAYCAATARDVLGKMPERIDIKISGNMLKNAMGVVIPHTNGLRGTKAAAILGVVGGDATRKLEVLETLTTTHLEMTKELLTGTYAQVIPVDGDIKLYVEVRAYHQDEYAAVEIKHHHTNIIKIEKNNQIKWLASCHDEDFNTSMSTRDLLNVNDIVEFSSSVELSDLIPLLDLQIEKNYAVAKQGMEADFGLNVGSTLLKHIEGNDLVRKAKAYTAAASDARMSGCTLPVVTNSGSGNQGITASVPLIVYSEHKNISKERLYRALILSNLITIHIKTKLGRLSAFCGVVVAASGAACGITYLEGGDVTKIGHTIKNILANISGMFCDGAKPSCAAKIASCIDAAFQASILAVDGFAIEANAGIIYEDIEATINNIGEIGKTAMKETDKKIIEIMSRVNC